MVGNVVTRCGLGVDVAKAPLADGKQRRVEAIFGHRKLPQRHWRSGQHNSVGFHGENTIAGHHVNFVQPSVGVPDERKYCTMQYGTVPGTLRYVRMDGYIEIKSHAKYGHNNESTTRVSLVLWYKQAKRKKERKKENLQCVYDA